MNKTIKTLLKLISILPLMAALQLQAQSLKDQIEIEKGSLFKVKGDEVHRSVITAKEGDFYAFDIQIIKFTDQNQKVIIFHFDSNLKLLKSKEIKLKFDKVIHTFVKGVFLNDKLYLMTKAQLNKKNDENTLHFHLIDKKTLEVTQSEAIPLTKYPEEENRSSSFILNKDKFLNSAENVKYKFSEDKSKLIIKSPVAKYKNSLLYFSFKVIDTKNNFQQLWEYGFFQKEEEIDFDVDDFKVNNNGEAALLFKEDGEEINFTVLNHFFTIKHINSTGQLNYEHKLEYKDEHLTRLKLAFNSSNKITLAGFYYVKEKGIVGRYFATIDLKTKSFLNEKKFDLSRISSLTNYHKIDSLIFLSDGSSILVAEYKRYSGANPSAGQASWVEGSDAIVSRRSIILIYFSKSGELKWSKRIQKKQGIEYSRWLYTSYHLSVVNDKLYFFHIDNPKNIGKYTGSERWMLSKKSKVIITEIDQKGNMRNTAMLNFKEDKTVLLPLLMRETTNGKILGYAKWGRKARYYRFTIKE